MLTGVTPSVYVKSQGPVPVNVIVTSGIGSPAQIVPPPLTTAVGEGFIVIGKTILSEQSPSFTTKVTSYVPAVVHVSPEGEVAVDVEGVPLVKDQE